MADREEQTATQTPEDAAREVLDATFFPHTAISLLEQVKIQAQVLVPMLKTLRAELGTERANQLARTALRGWIQQLYQEMDAQLSGSPRQKWEGLNAAWLPRIGTDIDVEMLKQEPEAMEFNVTGCRYADFFRQLGEPELGALLLCEADFAMAALGSPDVTMTRTQTIMQGASHCDFRYRLKTAGDAE